MIYAQECRENENAEKDLYGGFPAEGNVPVLLPSFEISQIISGLGPASFAERRYPALYDQFRRAFLDRSVAVSGVRVVCFFSFSALHYSYNRPHGTITSATIRFEWVGGLPHAIGWKTTHFEHETRPLPVLT